MRPVFIVVIEFLVIWIMLFETSLDWVSSPLFPKGSARALTHPPSRLGLPAPVHKACGLGQEDPAGVGLQAHPPPGLFCPFQTHRAAEASNVKGPVYSSNPERKGVNKIRNIHALNSLGREEGT